MPQFDALPSYLERIDSVAYRQMMVPEWLRLYLDYSTLNSLMVIAGELRHKKELLKESKKNVYQAVKSDEELIVKVINDKHTMLQVLDQELQKISAFLLYKSQDLSLKLTQLIEQAKLMRSQIIQSKEKQEVLKQQFYELYRQQLQFSSFINTHMIIIQQFQFEADYCFRIQILQNDRTILGQLDYKLNDDMQKTAQLLTINFYPYDPEMCRKNLEKYKNKRITKSINIFYLGLFFGVSIVIVSILLLMRLEGKLDPEDQKLFSPIFPSIRGGALLLIYYWLLTLDQYLWIKYHINYKLYLGFNHHFSTLTEVIKRVSFLSAIYLIFFLITCIQVEGIAFQEYGRYIKVLPLLYWIIFIGYLLIPTQKKLNGQGRRWMFRMLTGALFTHFFLYDGRYTFVLDQFVSLFSPIRDFEYTVCYYSMDLFRENEEIQHYKKCEQGQRIVGDICLMVVFGLKCLHCLTLAKKNGKFFNTPEMWNFSKNLLAVSVGFVGCLNKFDKSDAILWIILAASFTVVQQYWEIKKDWLLLQPNSKYKFLRSDLGYINPSFYYFFVPLNMLVISAWAFTISPQMYQYLKIPNQELFMMVIGIMELTRRFIHNLLKVEKEHTLNLKQFKASKDLVYPYQQIDDVIAKARQTQTLSSSLLDLQRHSLDFRKTTYLKQDIENLLKQPFDTSIMKTNAMINRQELIKGLQTDKYLQKLNSYS